MSTSRLASLIVRPSPRFATRVLLAASLVMLAILIYAGRWLTFWSDEWMWILRRPDPSVESWLRGSDVHLHLFPTLIYQSLFRLVGLGSYFPYLTVLWTFHFACVWLLFVVTARLTGWGFALVAALSTVFLGCGFEVLFQPGQMGYTLAQATGLLALWLLLRAGDADARPTLCRTAAAVALWVGTVASGVGLIFVGLLIVWTTLRRDWRGLVATLPALAFYAAWFPFFAERTTERIEPSLSGLQHAAAAVGYGLGATLCAVLGLPPYRFGFIGLALLVALLVVVLWRGGRFDALAWAAAAALVAEFILVAGFRPSFGVTWGSRSGYLYPAVGFFWLLAAGVWASGRWRPVPRIGPWVAVAVLVLAIVGNMMQLTGAARGMRVLRANELLYLRMVEALRGSEDMRGDGPRTLGIEPRRYLAAMDRFGAPRIASREPTLTDIGYAQPGFADEALLRLIGGAIALVPRAGVDGAAPQVAVSGGTAGPMGPSCVRVDAGPDVATAIWRPEGRAFAVEGTGPGAVSNVRLGVYAAPSWAPRRVRTEAGTPGAAVRLPALPAGLRWTAQVDVAPRQAALICGATPAAR